jgi:hypothetical protein
MEPGQAMADLLEQMRRNPQGNWSINDVAKVCLIYGLTCSAPRGGGSHYKVSHQRMPHILTVPFRRPIKPVYIRALVRYIDLIRKIP